MTFTFRFTLPYSGVSADRLKQAQQDAAANASAESDLSGFTGSDRQINGYEVVWTLNGLEPSDLSTETRQAIIDAIKSNAPGAADFEIV